MLAFISFHTFLLLFYSTLAMYSLQSMETTPRQKNLCSESWLSCIALLALLLAQQLKSQLFFSFSPSVFCRSLLHYISFYFFCNLFQNLIGILMLDSVTQRLVIIVFKAKIET